MRITWNQQRCVCVCVCYILTIPQDRVCPPFLASVGGDPVNSLIIVLNMAIPYSHQDSSAVLMDNFCHLSHAPLIPDVCHPHPRSLGSQTAHYQHTKFVGSRMSCRPEGDPFKGLEIFTFQILCNFLSKSE